MQHDIYRSKDDKDIILLDCQASLLSHLPTRLIAPMYLLKNAPKAVPRLNPRVEIEDQSYILMTNYASAMLSRQLGKHVGSLASERDRIIAAFDMLLTGI